MSDLKAQQPDVVSTMDKAAGAAADTASSVAEQGQAVAQTAVAEARDVAVHAKDQVASLTAETREQAMQALDSATSELENQLDQRLGDVSSMARTTAEELRALCDGRPQDAGRTADFARQASQRLDRFAERTDQLGVRGAAEEVADFGRRRPVAFLVGATVAGVLVGRMARAGKSAQDSNSSSGPPSPQPTLSAQSGPGASPEPNRSVPLRPATVPPQSMPTPTPTSTAPVTTSTTVGAAQPTPSASPVPGGDR